MKSSWMAAPLLASALLVIVLAPASHAWADVTVPSDWPLIPHGVDSGDEFRLLFGTHETTQVLNNQGFEIFDNYVAQSANKSDPIREYADEFKALVSCGNVNAMTHTSTTHSSDDPGVPIYWLLGEKVADDYVDFYDGSWDSNEARDQYGHYDYTSKDSGDLVGKRKVAVSDIVWTGTNSDGTSSRNHACSSNITIGQPHVHESELQAYVAPNYYNMSMYGISSVFTVSVLPSAPSAPTVVSTTHNTASIKWEAPAAHGATPIFDYNVQIRPAGGTWVGSTPFHYGTDTAHTLTGLSPDTEYEVRVLAKNHRDGGSETGYGPWSPVATFRTAIGISVPADWLLKPAGLDSGDSFRLLFVTSGMHDAVSTNISVYNQFVQAQARDGHNEIRQYGGDFRVLGSVSEMNDALTNTNTYHTSDDPGLPIYWLGGAKVADDYGDFWDGCWDSNQAQNQNGEPVQGIVWTGTNSDGTHSSSYDLGLEFVVTGSPLVQCKEINANAVGYQDRDAGMYGLSPIFTVS